MTDETQDILWKKQALYNKVTISLFAMMTCFLILAAKVEIDEFNKPTENSCSIEASLHYDR